MDDIPALVEDFFTASGKGEATKDKFRDLLPVSIRFLLSSGVNLGDIPNDDNIKHLDDYLQTVPNRMGKTYSASTIGDWERITNEFFTYRHKTKGEAQMTIPEDTITDDIPMSEAQPDETPIQQNMTADNETEKRKPGRPIKGDEGRDKKITVNIPTSIFNDIKDMANIDNVTFPDCVNAILENAVNDRWDDIQAIRALRARRHI